MNSFPLNRKDVTQEGGSFSNEVSVDLFFVAVSRMDFVGTTIRV